MVAASPAEPYSPGGGRSLPLSRASSSASAPLPAALTPRGVSADYWEGYAAGSAAAAAAAARPAGWGGSPRCGEAAAGFGAGFGRGAWAGAPGGREAPAAPPRADARAADPSAAELGSQAPAPGSPAGLARAPSAVEVAAAVGAARQRQSSAPTPPRPVLLVSQARGALCRVACLSLVSEWMRELAKMLFV